MHNMHYENGTLGLNRMNPIRKTLLDRIGALLRVHRDRQDVGDLSKLQEAQKLNQEFIDRSRGKGRG